MTLAARAGARSNLFPAFTPRQRSRTGRRTLGGAMTPTASAPSTAPRTNFACSTLSLTPSITMSGSVQVSGERSFRHSALSAFSAAPVMIFMILLLAGVFQPLQLAIGKTRQGLPDLVVDQLGHRVMDA